MNLNREQFLRAVEQGRELLERLKRDYPELKLRAVFSRFGPRSGQCDLAIDLKKIVMEFPEMLVGEHMSYNDISKNSPLPRKLRGLLFEIRAANKAGEKKKVSNLWKEAGDVESRLLDPESKLYCGDVLVEYRCGVLRHESIRRLQQDPRLPPELNAVGNIRVVAGSLEGLSNVE